MIIIGVDTGGTFTDFVYKDEQGWGVYKLLSTPSNPAEAVLAGIRHITKSDDIQVIHGSTVATNAILEKKGALTALITNRGFEDVIEIGRQNRTRLYDLAYRKNPPLVPRNLRFGINCRVIKDGTILKDLQDEELRQIIQELKAAHVQSVAVSFLFSFQNADHEKKVGEWLHNAGIPYSLSHEILAEFREFERTSTTIINAYVSPKMNRYISHITDHISQNRLRIMQSNGGSISAMTAGTESVRTILSGPAGGAVGAFELGKMAGFDQLISFDMGGTSTDVALMDGALPLTLESTIDDYPVRVPMIAIHTVGAGGGSIAYIDAGGALKVGPESAGAEPGPICYGKGDRITVTDANLFLGRLLPDHFLGGHMTLETHSLNRHFEDMSQKLRMSPTELAEGIISVVNANMERAIRVISVERGFDPRHFVLFSFGGAGSLHAAFLAKLLNIPNVLVPKNPGILSAIGMLMADIIKDYSQTVMLETKDSIEIDALFGPVVEKGRTELAAEGVASENILIEKYLDMRYRGQSYEIIVPFSQDYQNTFHELHEKTYGYCNRDKMVEIVNIRIRARGKPEKPTFPKTEYAGKTVEPQAVIDHRPVIFDGNQVNTAILLRDHLKHGNMIYGPAIIAEYSSTIIIPPGMSASLDTFENIIIHTL